MEKLVLLGLLVEVLFLRSTVCDEDSCHLYSSVKRTLAKDGFHRRLEYFIELPLIKNREGCKLMVEEVIPDSFYVDENELNDPTGWNRLPIWLNDTVDVESPKKLSKPFLLRFYADLIEFNRILVSKASFPIHVRYHTPQRDAQTVRASLNDPSIYLHCPKLACPGFNRVLPCSFKTTDQCLYKSLYNIINSTVSIDVPVGNLNHYTLVVTVTNFVACFGTVYLLYVMIFCTRE